MTSVLRRDEVRAGAVLPRAQPGARLQPLVLPAAQLPGAASGTAQVSLPLGELPSVSSTPVSQRGCSAGAAALRASLCTDVTHRCLQGFVAVPVE